MTGPGIRVTATDLADDSATTVIEIIDGYVLVTAGSCFSTQVTVHQKADGTDTHQITVVGIRRRPAGQHLTEELVTS